MLSKNKKARLGEQGDWEKASMPKRTEGTTAMPGV